MVKAYHNIHDWNLAEDAYCMSCSSLLAKHKTHLSHFQLMSYWFIGNLRALLATRKIAQYFGFVILVIKC